MTKAQEISKALGNDGTTWETRDGVTFSQLVSDADQQHRPSGNNLFIFEDGSAIVENGEWWDIASFYVVRLDHSIVDEWGNYHQTHKFSHHKLLSAAVKAFKKRQKQYNHVDIVDHMGCPVDFIY